MSQVGLVFFHCNGQIFLGISFCFSFLLKNTEMVVHHFILHKYSTRTLLMQNNIYFLSVLCDNKQIMQYL